MAASPRRSQKLAYVAILAAMAVTAGTLVGMHLIRHEPPADHATGAVTSPSTSASESPKITRTLPKKLGPGARYVNLGDSYAAGTGERDLAPGAPVRCQRTASNPGARLAQRMKWSIHDVSCTSATTAHLTESQHPGLDPQLDALDDTIDVVTVSLGANDGQFFGFLVSKCAGLGEDDPTGSPCRDQYADELTDMLQNETGPSLRDAYAEIAKKAPNAEIYAIGYPWLVPESGACRPELRFADGDIRFARELQDQLNAEAKTAVEAAGGTFVDMSVRADGHDGCAAENVRWVEPANDADGNSLGVSANHPNARGQRAMADALEAAVRTPR